MERFPALEIRDTVKIILPCDEDIVVVAGESGRLNLPGGGREDGDVDDMAVLDRELLEEIAIGLNGLSRIRPLCGVKDITTPRGNRPPRLSQWSVYTGMLEVPTQNLRPGSDEIKDVQLMNFREFLESDHASDLAKRAIRAWASNRIQQEAGIVCTPRILSEIHVDSLLRAEPPSRN